MALADDFATARSGATSPPPMMGGSKREALRRGLLRHGLLSQPHPSQTVEGPTATPFGETMAGVGPMNAHPRPAGMGDHMGGPGRTVEGPVPAPTPIAPSRAAPAPTNPYGALRTGF